MRHFVKVQEPASLVAWKNLANEDWRPSYDVLQNPEKSDLHRNLLREQFWLCCYCGRKIDLSDSHVEHFRPQETYDGEELNYDNLHASCIRAPAPGGLLHCGHAKGSHFDELQYLSPLNPDVESFFIIDANGAISPLGSRASYMIKLLKLDSPPLEEGRRQAIAGILDEEFLATASGAELAAVAERFASPNGFGELPPFAHAVTSVLRRLLGS